MADSGTVNLNKYSECLEYIESYWEKLRIHSPHDHGTLIGLPRPFLTANHAIFQEMYYWDSFFISVGLKFTPFAHHIVDMTENLLYLFERFGRIPNASRFYFLSRSQPPFLTSMIKLSLEVLEAQGASHHETRNFLERGYLIAQKEYWSIWRGKQFPDQREMKRYLSRYFDLNIWHNAAEAESGWDMTPRFENRCLDFLAVDLNSLLFQYESDFMDFSKIVGDGEFEGWKRRRERRREVMNEVLWDAEKNFFFDFDLAHERRSTFYSLAGFFPLWAGITTPEQSSRMVELSLQKFEYDFGLATTEEWKPAQGEVHKQWAWPNGWAPLHWIVVEGLARQGFEKEATRLATKWLDLVNRIYLQNNTNFEKYDVVRGERAVEDRYPDQLGFGWTNGVFLSFVNFLKEGKFEKTPHHRR
ncbi:MAG: hypothetical protein KDD64_01325 [Bdellovibrionales bacterium]|nr:hypothetical protein [Bdellovibrionales bacterium]